MEEVMEDFKNSLLELSTQLSTNTIIIVGGVLHHQKERILKIINNLLTPRVFISKLGDSVGVYGAISPHKSKRKAKFKGTLISAVVFSGNHHNHQ